MKLFAVSFFVILSVISFSYGQKNPLLSESIADCSGAINLLNPGSFSLQFTGKYGVSEDFKDYPSLKSIPETNTIWCSFKSSYAGRFTMQGAVAAGPLKAIIFEQATTDICEDILKGKAEIRRLINGTGTEVGLDLITDDHTLYPIDLDADDHIMLCFIVPAKSREKLELQINFEPSDGEMHVDSLSTKIIDTRTNRDISFLNVKMRDVETGKPVISNITVEGMKGKSSLYSASDLYLQIDRSGKIMFHFDAQGYFFVDREEPVSGSSDNELIVWLEPLGEGKSMQIDEIEFHPGSSEFLVTAESKLRRLKDFLALNSNVKVEIQGHVHANGKNSIAGQKLSEARAKRVMNYLVENGIDKDRLKAVGYGNTAPIYPEAKFAYEEQANRRVEIKVL